ncbi:MAG: hypothetical protein KA763_02580 [Xanthomonadales bacterium]|nr:hypothetical protein [Xanthomonadales bacterium]
MNPTRIALFLCTVLTTFALAAKEDPAAAANLLKNGQFEELNGRGGAANWINKQHAGVRAYRFEVVEDQAHGGKRSLMLRRMTKQVWGKTEQLLPVGAELTGKTVEFEVWVRSDKVGKKGFLIWLGASARSLLLQHVKSDRIGGDSDWTRHALRLDIPEYTTQLVVAVTLEDEGTIWIDDAKLTVVDPAD